METNGLVVIIIQPFCTSMVTLTKMCYSVIHSDSISLKGSLSPGFRREKHNIFSCVSGCIKGLQKDIKYESRRSRDMTVIDERYKDVPLYRDKKTEAAVGEKQFS